jgi:3-dehydroquinate dehydratase type II
MKSVLVINGPNLNLLGTREPEVYGTVTLAELEAMIVQWGRELGIGVETFQSNHEGAIVEALHRARDEADGVVINGGALTHYSYSIHDAITATDLPTVEIHISNIHAREPWRRESVTAPACDYVIYGRGLRGYSDALARLRNTADFPPERIPYGDGADQFGELRVPPGAGPHPVAVLFHGGFWRDVWTNDLMDGLAIDLVERGWAAWNVEYRRVGNGGGFPLSMEDAATAVDALAGLAPAYELDLERVAAVGHSAGGQLALWAAKRSPLYEPDPAGPPMVRPGTVVALAAVSDLREAHRLDLGLAAVEGFLRRTPEDGPDRYDATSPIELLPLGARSIVVHGTGDQIVPQVLSRDFVAAAAAAGDPTELVVADGEDHFDVIDPKSFAWQEAARRLDG